MRRFFNDVGAPASGEGNYLTRSVLTDSSRFPQADVGFPGGTRNKILKKIDGRESNEKDFDIGDHVLPGREPGIGTDGWRQGRNESATDASRQESRNSHHNNKNQVWEKRAQRRQKKQEKQRQHHSASKITSGKLPGEAASQGPLSFLRIWDGPPAGYIVNHYRDGQPPSDS